MNSDRDIVGKERKALTADRSNDSHFKAYLSQMRSVMRADEERQRKEEKFFPEQLNESLPLVESKLAVSKNVQIQPTDFDPISCPSSAIIKVQDSKKAANDMLLKSEPSMNQSKYSHNHSDPFCKFTKNADQQESFLYQRQNKTS